MIAPSGDQIEIALGGQRATIVEVGGGLRAYSAAGRELIDGYGIDEMSSSGRGQVLLPWPNRIKDGSYEFDGRRHQLPINDVEEQDAIHGLVRWAAWRVGEHEPHRVVMQHLIHPQPGYPFSLAVSIEYLLSDGGLRVRTTATNAGAGPCPYGCGAHPYLSMGTQVVDSVTLQAPGRTVLLSDERGIPVGSESVEGTEYDFRRPRRIAATRLDNAFTDLERDGDGLARVSLSDPEARQPDALGRRVVPVPDAVYRRPATRCRPAQPRRRAHDLPTERVSDRRSPDPSGARPIVHEHLGDRCWGLTYSRSQPTSAPRGARERSRLPHRPRSLLEEEAES